MDNLGHNIVDDDYCKIVLEGQFLEKLSVLLYELTPLKEVDSSFSLDEVVTYTVNVVDHH